MSAIYESVTLYWYTNKKYWMYGINADILNKNPINTYLNK